MFCTITNCTPPPTTALQYKSKLGMLKYIYTSPETIVPVSMQSYKVNHGKLSWFTLCFANWGLQGDYGLFCTITFRSTPPPTTLQYGSKLYMIIYTVTSTGTFLPASLQRYKVNHDRLSWFTLCFANWGFQGDYGLFCNITFHSTPSPTTLQYRNKIYM